MCLLMWDDPLEYIVMYQKSSKSNLIGCFRLCILNKGVSSMTIWSVAPVSMTHNFGLCKNEDVL